MAKTYNKYNHSHRVIPAVEPPVVEEVTLPAVEEAIQEAEEQIIVEVESDLPEIKEVEIEEVPFEIPEIEEVVPPVVEEKVVEKVQPKVNTTVKVGHTRLRIRKDANLQAEDTGLRLDPNQIVILDGEKNNFGHLADGRGWICLDFVTKEL